MENDIPKIEQIWDEANMFARDIISGAWIDLNWDELPKDVQDQFRNLVSEKIPRD